MFASRLRFSRPAHGPEGGGPVGTIVKQTEIELSIRL